MFGRNENGTVAAVDAVGRRRHKELIRGPRLGGPGEPVKGVLR